MKFANHYIFLISKNKKLRIKAYNYEFIARFMYSYYYDDYLKLMVTGGDTSYVRGIIKDYMSNENDK